MLTAMGMRLLLPTVLLLFLHAIVKMELDYFAGVIQSQVQIQ